MTDGFVLGVDLGTSHTVAMLHRPDGRTRPLLFDGQPLLPSAVYLDTTGRLHVGRDAVRLGQAEPGRLEPNPKRQIDAETVLLGGADVPTADLLAALLAAVAREAVAATGFLPPAVLTYPAAWGAQRREVLTTALAKAGWPPATQLLPEPVAAARYFADVLRRPVPVGSALAVFDFGGGTLDIAVVRNEGVTADGLPRFVVAASGGVDDLGGLDLDAALVTHLGTGLEKHEPAAWAALTDPVTLAQWRARRQFWDDVRGAKEMLSRTASAPVAVPGVEHAVHLTRDEFEAAAGPLVRRGVAEAGEVIRAAGLAPTDLAGLFLVGGSSRVPLVARLLHSELGIAPTVLEQPELPVAEGAIIEVAPADPARTPAEPMRPAAVPPETDTMAHGGPTLTDAAENGASAARERAGAVAVAGNDGGGAGAAAGRSVGAAAGEGAGGAAPASGLPPQTRQSADAIAGAAATPGDAAAPSNADGQGNVAAQGNSAGEPRAAAAPAQAGPHTASGQAGPHGQIGPEPQYAEPVDPWATGEAAAFGNAGGGPIVHPTSGAPVSATPTSPPLADTWLASTHPDPGAPSARAKLPAYRRKWVWVVAVLTVVVLGVAGTAVALLWPGYSALDYRPLSELHRLPPAVPITSSFSGAAVRDGRAYFANADKDGTLGVVAAATESGKPAWNSVEAGVAARWEFFFDVPGALVAITDTDSATSTRRMVVLDAGNGHKRWERPLGANDTVLPTGDRIVQVDRAENRLVGLAIADGGVAWDIKSPKSEYGVATTQVVLATTEDDFAGPASTTGDAFAEPFDDDQRIVQIGADESARVIDAGTGKVVAGPRQSVAQPDDQVIAHNGRLVVAESGDAHRLLSYDLAKLGEPKVLYTPKANVQAEKLTACGADRVCAIETTGYAAKSAQVIAVDAAEGGEVWRREVPDANVLVPVGEALLVTQNTSVVQTALIDAKGKQLWNRPGSVGRIDGGNVLEFSKTVSDYAEDPALAGEHVGDSPVPLGSLVAVRTSACAWDTSYLACVADEDLIIQKFAG